MPAKKTASKAKYHHGDLRKALIDASLDIIAREGAEALTLRSAARAAGVSHAAPYAHYEDKEDLIAAVKDDCFRELHQSLVDGLGDRTDPPLVRLETMARIYLAFAAEQPAKYTIMFKRPLAKEPSATFHYIEIGREIFRMLAAEVGGALEAHGRKLDPQLVTLTSWSTLHGLCALWNDGPIQMIMPKGTRYDALAKRFVDYIIGTIRGH